MSNEYWWNFLDGVFVAGLVYIATLLVLIRSDKRKKPVIKTVKGDEALRLWLNQLKAQAWQEGIEAFDVAITKDVDDPWSQLPPNPYRQGEEQ